MRNSDPPTRVSVYDDESAMDNSAECPSDRLVTVVGLYCAAGDPESGSAAIDAGNDDHVPLPSLRASAVPRVEW